MTKVVKKKLCVYISVELGIQMTKCIIFFTRT